MYCNVVKWHEATNKVEVTMERESMAFDVVIVGAGPSGLACACKLMQLAKSNDTQLSVCVVEKGSEVGAHILSGAIFETTAMTELFPDWQSTDHTSSGAPISVKVSKDEVYYFSNSESAVTIPHFCVPKTMHNEENYVVSMGNICRWMANQAESLGVEIFPGFPAQEVLYHSDGSVAGIITGDMGLDKAGNKKDSYTQGMALEAKYTVFSEGARGHLGKELIEKFKLAKGKATQHYAIGFKEVWDVPAEKHQSGLVIHTAGWPLDKENSGGGYLYHGENNQVYVGLIVNLDYQNPYLDPFEEFQRYKHHPKVSQFLTGGERVSYGARAITKGGYNALPKMTMPGAVLIGCDAGTINFAKIKGNHTAMKSGMIAAESIYEAIELNEKCDGEVVAGLDSFEQKFKQSWLYRELYGTKNFGAALHIFGPLVGGIYNWFDQNICSGSLPFKLSHHHPDHLSLSPTEQAHKPIYNKPDGVLSFDKLSSVFLSNSTHEENQPSHLVLADKTIPLTTNLTHYDEPAQRYCPAGVYEVVMRNNQKNNDKNKSCEKVADTEASFVINSQNCIHCKTCDIKDPSQNITWRAPEGGGGPNYPNM